MALKNDPWFHGNHASYNTEILISHRVFPTIGLNVMFKSKIHNTDFTISRTISFIKIYMK